MGLRQKVIAICALRERKRGSEKEPIMLCRIADRGLLFGYLGNKMLSLYEDWREERDSFFIPRQTIQYCCVYLISMYIKDQMINMRKENFKTFFFISHLILPFPFSTFFEFLLALSVHSKGDVEKGGNLSLCMCKEILNYGSHLWTLPFAKK